MLDGEGTDEEERNMQFSFSTPREIVRGMKRKELKMSLLRLFYKGINLGVLPTGQGVQHKVSRPIIHSWEATNYGRSSSLSSIQSSPSLSSTLEHHGR